MNFLDLMNQVLAIVTGAAQGIGFAIAERLLSAGASVVVADVDGKGAHEAAGQLHALGAGIGIPLAV